MNVNTTTSKRAPKLTGERLQDPMGRYFYRIPLTGRDGAGRFALLDDAGKKRLHDHGATALYLVNDGQGREYVTFCANAEGSRWKKAMLAARVILGNPQGARIQYVSGDRLDLRQSNLHVRRYEGVGEGRAPRTPKVAA